ncbi:MAG: MFS transporter [Planctomycetota bacterium]
MSTPGKRVMGPVFLTVFLDLVGFSVLFPLFPELLEHYLSREGPDSVIGQLHANLVELVGDRAQASFAVTALFGGVLGSVYSILQFAFAPIWGSLSDRVGRRPVLLVTLAGTAGAYLLWFFAGSFGLLVASRLIAGIMAGNVATASAVVADVYPPAQRSRGMAAVGAAIGLGFVVGPALGAIAYHAVDLTVKMPVWTDRYGVNPFSSAAAVSLGLACLNWLLVAVRLPETLDRSHVPERRGILAVGRLGEIGRPGLVGTHVVYLGYMILFSAMEFTLVFLTTERLEYSAGDNAVMFVFIGLMIALVQGGFVRRAGPRLGEKRLATTGLVLLVPGFLLVGLVPGVGASGAGVQLYGGLTLLAAGSAMVMPSLSALASRLAPDGQQGLVQGTLRSMGSLARAIGPLLGGLAYWSLASSAPYVLGSALLLLPLALCLRLPDPGVQPAEGSGR